MVKMVKLNGWRCLRPAATNGSRRRRIRPPSLPKVQKPLLGPSQAGQLAHPACFFQGISSHFPRNIDVLFGIGHDCACTPCTYSPVHSCPGMCKTVYSCARPIFDNLSVERGEAPGSNRWLPQYQCGGLPLTYPHRKNPPGGIRTHNRAIHRRLLDPSSCWGVLGRAEESVTAKSWNSSTRRFSALRMTRARPGNVPGSGSYYFITEHPFSLKIKNSGPRRLSSNVGIPMAQHRPRTIVFHRSWIWSYRPCCPDNVYREAFYSRTTGRHLSHGVHRLRLNPQVEPRSVPVHQPRSESGADAASAPSSGPVANTPFHRRPIGCLTVPASLEPSPQNEPWNVPQSLHQEQATHRPWNIRLSSHLAVRLGTWLLAIGSQLSGSPLAQYTDY